MNLTRLLLVGALGLSSTPIVAKPGKYEVTTDKYHVTAEEREACQEDAVALCSAAFPDEEMLLACMKTNRVQLSAGCRTVFEAGLRKRHIQF